jgi:hypothetical protein
MIERHISKQTAKMAKKKGLDLDLDLGDNCACYFIKTPPGYGDDYVLFYHVHTQYPDRKRYLFAPTQGYFQKWLREEHKIIVISNYEYFDDDKRFFFQIYYGKNERYFNEIHERDKEYFITYEDALEAGFKIVLKEIM